MVYLPKLAISHRILLRPLFDWYIQVYIYVSIFLWARRPLLRSTLYRQKPFIFAHRLWRCPCLYFPCFNSAHSELRIAHPSHGFPSAFTLLFRSVELAWLVWEENWTNTGKCSLFHAFLSQTHSIIFFSLSWKYNPFVFQCLILPYFSCSLLLLNMIKIKCFCFWQSAVLSRFGFMFGFFSRPTIVEE